MRRWVLSTELSEAEQGVAGRLGRGGRFYVFLRQVAPRLFDEGFQAELEKAYGTPTGTEPKPPALLAMVTLLQAYDRVSDWEAVETATVDLRWQLVLGCIGATEAPFSQGVLVSFRERMVAHDLDRKLLDRTVELAHVEPARPGARHGGGVRGEGAVDPAGDDPRGGRVEAAVGDEPEGDPGHRLG
jgi:hypothetical protein